MLVIWRDPPYTHDEQQHVNDTLALDRLLDRLHHDAAATGHHNAVILYAGNHYPQEAHAENGRWIPDDPGDGEQPELILTVGASESPLYWDEPGGPQHTSHGPRPVTQPEPEYYFQYLYGGQESYATESSLIPAMQAREAARLFLQNDGKRPGNVAWQFPPDASRDALTRLDLDDADMAEALACYDSAVVLAAAGRAVPAIDQWFRDLGEALLKALAGDVSDEIRDRLLAASANRVRMLLAEQRYHAAQWQAELASTAS